jgi:hypothetical protein
MTITGCFAGHCDWRLPTVVELQTILLAAFPCGTHPCLDPAVGPTQPGFYWSTTTSAGNPDYAWIVSSFDGFVDTLIKTANYYARAVRNAP